MFYALVLSLAWICVLLLLLWRTNSQFNNLHRTSVTTLNTITELKKHAKENLAELRTLTSSLSEVNIVTDFSPDISTTLDSEGKITNANNKWFYTLGWDPEYLYLRKFIDFVIPTYHAVILTKMYELPEGEVVAIDIPTKHANGNFVWINWKFLRASKDELVISGRDVTETKRKELELDEHEEVAARISKAVRAQGQIDVKTLASLGNGTYKKWLTDLDN